MAFGEWMDPDSEQAVVPLVSVAVVGVVVVSVAVLVAVVAAAGEVWVVAEPVVVWMGGLEASRESSVARRAVLFSESTDGSHSAQPGKGPVVGCWATTGRRTCPTSDFRPLRDNVVVGTTGVGWWVEGKQTKASRTQKSIRQTNQTKSVGGRLQCPVLILCLPGPPYPP